MEDPSNETTNRPLVILPRLRRSILQQRYWRCEDDFFCRPPAEADSTSMVAPLVEHQSLRLLLLQVMILTSVWTDGGR